METGNLKKSDRSTRTGYQIAMIGDSGIGKTALLDRLSTGQFSRAYQPTVMQPHRLAFRCSVSNTSCPVLVFDIGGDRQFPAMYKLRLQEAQAFFLVFSIRSRSSFEEVKNLKAEIDKVKGDIGRIPIVLVGNQANEDHPLARREVSEKEARNLSLHWGCSYCETSARLNRNVNQIFESMMRSCKEILGWPHTAKTKKPKKLTKCAIQ
eukprot:m.311016 g.311016  ORF g.311016 m.311016 type:complete len:208 (+) comp58143_c0_seq1:544-1167(+)